MSSVPPPKRLRQSVLSSFTISKGDLIIFHFTQFGPRFIDSRQLTDVRTAKNKTCEKKILKAITFEPDKNLKLSMKFDVVCCPFVFFLNILSVKIFFGGIPFTTIFSPTLFRNIRQIVIVEIGRASCRERV